MPDLKEYNTDLHLHGLYAGAVSDKMIPKVIGEQAPLKGLQIVGTGDILNERWIKLVKEQLKPIDEGAFQHENGTIFVLQTEVEDQNRVHHIILFPTLSKVYEVREKLKSHTKDLDSEGRPKVHLSGFDIAEIAVKAGCLIGPSHAFTPWTAIFKEYNSLKDCYKEYTKNVHFLELGLSADTDMADRVSELHDITFLSNSDAHSPWPNKLGREFTRFLMKEPSFDELAKALKRDNGRKPILNVKLNPKEGKYHKTRCMGCLLFFELKDAEKFNWKCPNCKKSIKKGVYERIEELADLKEPKHPAHRPPCIHTIPLSEIVAIAYDIKQVFSQKVQSIWKVFVDKFGSEIKVLIDVPIEELALVDKKVADYVKYFREDKFKYVPGGAGIYGIPIPPGKPLEIKYFKEMQKSLGDFK